MTASSSTSSGRPTLVAGKYQVTRFIKAGGMGEVYEARHLRLGRRVAIKFLRAALIQDAAHLARFEREACAAGGLEHENVAALFDIGSDEQGTPFIVMEYIDGETLRKIIDERAPLPMPRAVGIVLQICAGLEAAHARGIVHRDLKPENLMVCRRTDGRDWVKVLDFGIARLTDDKAQTDVTATGVVLGTSHYMSPEQARGEDTDARTDVHAVGAILYELLSGKKAHPGETYNAVIYHLLSKDLLPLDALRPSLPSALVAAVHRALAPAAAQRFDSIADFAKALHNLADLATATAESETGTNTRSVVRSSTRTRWVWGLSMAVLAGLSLARYASQRLLERPSDDAVPRVEAYAVPVAPQAALPALINSAAATGSESAPSPTAPIPIEEISRPKGATSIPRKRLVPIPPPTNVGGAPSAAVPEGFVENPYGK